MLGVRVRRGAVAAVLGGGTIAAVSSATANYLDAHPDVNAFFTGLRGQTRDAARGQLVGYLAANPGVRNDLLGIRQPLIDMRNRCGPFFAGPPAPPPPGAPM
ncbi:MAG: heme-binding protein [Mycobacterium sp.]|nr:heme-binding protein [Mycobacterium sp.]